MGILIRSGLLITLDRTEKLINTVIKHALYTVIPANVQTREHK